MMRKLAVAAMVGALTVGAAVAAPAQSRGAEAGWWEWAAPTAVGGEEIRTRRGQILVPEPVARRGEPARRREAKGNAPAFCRSGAGHPVHGRRWCVDKGWGLGERRADARWERRGWEDVVFRTPAPRRAAVLDEEALAEALGRAVIGRLHDHRGRLGAAGPLTGRWTRGGESGRVLQLRAGGVPIAELSDLSGDDRVDLVLLFRGD